MSVYVDPALRFGSHMYADSEAELHALAARLGLKREGYQHCGGLPHYDLTRATRELAVRAGAVEHSSWEMVKFKRALERRQKQARRA